VENNNLKKGIITLYYKLPTAGHAEGYKTLLSIRRLLVAHHMRRYKGVYKRVCHMPGH
jgi:hypothetical protein